MPIFAIPRRASGQSSGSQSAHEPRWTRQLVACAAAAMCLLSAGGAIAYYTAAEVSGNAAGSKPGLRYADVTDSWLDAVRSGSMWNKSRGRSSGERSGRSNRESSSGRDSERRSGRSRTSNRGERTRSSERESSSSEESRPRSRTQTTTSETRRAIRESTETHYPSSYTTVPRSSQTIRYYSAVPQEYATYRTMCVRLCDGYYWPVSYSATKREFSRDTEICQRSCDSPVALHVYRNAGEEPENMVDVKGRPYIELDTAFLYRTSYDQACRCRPHPWEDASRLRHLSYDTASQTQSGGLGKP